VINYSITSRHWTTCERPQLSTTSLLLLRSTPRDRKFVLASWPM